MRQLMHRFPKCAGDRREGVGVASQRDRVADGLLGAARLERTDERLRHGALAGYVEAVAGPDFVHGPVQVIAVQALDFGSDLACGLAVQPHSYGVRHGSRAFQPFRVVVRDSGHPICRQQRLVEGRFAGEPGGGGDAHGPPPLP